MTVILDWQRASVKYPGSKDHALKNMSLQIHKGEFVCVLGRSGAGKSTFIRTINGLQLLTAGSVKVNGQLIRGNQDSKLKKVRSEIGMIFQHFHLIPRMTVKQNVMTGRFGKNKNWRNILGIFSDNDKALAKYYMSEVGLKEFEDRRVERLSGGQKQRVGIARAMVQEPSILLGDEPVASLDPTTSDYIFQILKRMHDEKELTTIINVHDVELAKKYASRIIGLREGKVVFDGSVESLTEEVLTSIYR
ncbi:phosphonate ABC transporter ATP-binding protein [Paenalkalicoccus suaedae]|uniref:Phosphonate ABC transporter ATP-binding protein n=1 Tax=Paenalkalicoccus suaedae TaxID=2592382 RepID=A0A859FEX8_9BACI|nr:phosphonate ABC transporter ATP-binding protein [Paenalkalicoccus suaedae]QKS71637.1 phosphonate ABC transporter ATP-binding protein [Paenalkalicoccus suaedae]